MSGGTLNENEVNALMEAIEDGNVPTSGRQDEPEVLPYDLTSQDRVIRGQMPTLDSINDRIASLFAAGLAGRTRLQIRVSTSPATLMKFADFNALLAPPATVGLIDLGTGFGPAALVLEAGLAEALLAAAMGDRAARRDVPSGYDGTRDLTNIDRLVLKKVLSTLTAAMRDAWRDVIPFEPELVRFETDPRLAVIAPPGDVAILSSFAIEGSIEGHLQLGIPYAAVEPAKKILSSPVRPGARTSARFAAAIARELEQVEVEVRAVLGRTRMALSEFLGLSVGDVVGLGVDEDDDIEVLVEGVPKLRGRPGTHNGSLTVTLSSQLAPPQSEQPIRELEAAGEDPSTEEIATQNPAAAPVQAQAGA
ncbi:MAG: flagellar motor switch protein FliM [Deltaproteobacteria bacterium]|nr:MAG: flagellar motor switch protein FliM [Deltaproteobacteria bacterium]